MNRYWDDSDAPRDESYFEDVSLGRLAKGDPQRTYREIRAAAESGWDFSSRWFADGRTLATIETSQITPVDLNALLFGLEGAIHAGCERAGDRDCVEGVCPPRRRPSHGARSLSLGSQRAASISITDWHGSNAWSTSAPRRSTHCSRALRARRKRLRVAEVSRGVAQAWRDLTTTFETGQQWDAPNGWATLQWIAVKGLNHFRAERARRTGRLPLAGQCLPASIARLASCWRNTM